MQKPVFCEGLEPRLLLDGVDPGAAALFDFDGDGTNDAVLVNTGATAIEYEVSGANGLALNLTGDGAAFCTNTWVEVADLPDDFILDAATVGTRVRYGCTWYDAIEGSSTVAAASIGRLDIGVGDLVSAGASEAGIGKVILHDGDLTDLSALTDIGWAIVEGDILGSIEAGGNIDRIAAEAIRGAEIIAGGNIGEIVADAITDRITETTTEPITYTSYIQAVDIDEIVAGTIDGGSEVLAIGDLGRLSADTITGGAVITVCGNLGRLSAGTIDGGTVITVVGDAQRITADTIAGDPSGTFLSILGNLDRLSAGTMTGGSNGGSLGVSVGGDAGTISADTITGGTNGILTFSIAGDLDRLNVGLLEGGQAVAGGTPSNAFTVGGSIDKICAGLISGGTGLGYAELLISAYDIHSLQATAIVGGNMDPASEAGPGGEAAVLINVANDLGQVRVGRILGTGSVHGGCDPAVMISVGHDIIKLVASEIRGGDALGDYAVGAVSIYAGNDIRSLVAGTIDAGRAEGLYAFAAVAVEAGHDINSVSASRITGGLADGVGATAGVYFTAGRNIDVIAAGLISGTQSRLRVHTPDPTVQFIAGGDIGLVLVGEINGGRINGGVSDGDDETFNAAACVLLEANGTYVDPTNGVRSEGNIDRIIAGRITGGDATGDALAYVKIHAANDIGSLCADTISGGQTHEAGAETYVNILAEHDIERFCVGTLIGAENGGDGGSGDSAVQVQAYNDIQSFCANRIIAGDEGIVNILAGEFDEDGNVVQAGSIERMVVNLINGDNGLINIAAGGDIEALRVCTITSGTDGDGEVNIIAGGDITADVRTIRSWTVVDDGEVVDSGVQFTAGGEVNGLRQSFRDAYVSEGEEVTFPAPSDFPEVPPGP